MDIAPVTPVFTAAGTVVAAIITGFGAASLKHRWDRTADQEAWQRQLGQLRQAEFAKAWRSYCEARHELAALVQRWSVGTIRLRATSASDADRSRWAPPPDESELAVVGLRLATAADSLALVCPFEDFERAFRLDCQQARKYALDCIATVQAGRDLEPLPEVAGLAGQARVVHDSFLLSDWPTA